MLPTLDRWSPSPIPVIHDAHWLRAMAIHQFGIIEHGCWPIFTKLKGLVLDTGVAAQVPRHATIPYCPTSIDLWVMSACIGRLEPYTRLMLPGQSP